MDNKSCPAAGHAVYSHTYAIARVGGVLINLWAVGVGLWILAFGDRIFARSFWKNFVDAGVHNFAGWFHADHQFHAEDVNGVAGVLPRSVLIS